MGTVTPIPPRAAELPERVACLRVEGPAGPVVVAPQLDPLHEWAARLIASATCHRPDHPPVAIVTHEEVTLALAEVGPPRVTSSNASRHR